MGDGMAESFVNELTGEVLAPVELVRELREVDRAIPRLDDVIAMHSAEAQAAKKDREKAIARMRSIIREVRILAAKKGRRASAAPKGEKA